jgi:hypothetical protein
MVPGLADAAQKVGDVVNLITAIAARTNLLALNATKGRHEQRTPAKAWPYAAVARQLDRKSHGRHRTAHQCDPGSDHELAGGPLVHGANTVIAELARDWFTETGQR